MSDGLSRFLIAADDSPACVAPTERLSGHEKAVPEVGGQENGTVVPLAADLAPVNQQ